ncbi:MULTISPECIES: hypothetical protein [Streptomyces]|uniref:Uncharacterized protein n=1 Tax=Streptomyces fradiae ATCC 10745 = DSM 40063 TaxID=1319510 RepID=A0A1Y2NWB0_STRFR|nr:MULTISPECIES: hypothetical protein [Streptomyces]KAF0649197.1 hypothetical protein K701_13895 [Streptomyces fradiae ATCC 10745 = DSM 40063]OSY51823.1 hypothetical protein BG846_02497 [Streptomyces fradiae ATCC 10745 = DSM 40063]QEV12029.1 hypothetical protein CP974_08360 [Streptomyces fradiae ATCC 10745 = DSM 40063]
MIAQKLAQALADYYHELIKHGLPHETAHQLVTDAGRDPLLLADLLPAPTDDVKTTTPSTPQQGVGVSESRD